MAVQHSRTEIIVRCQRSQRCDACDEIRGIWSRDCMRKKLAKGTTWIFEPKVKVNFLRIFKKIALCQKIDCYYGTWKFSPEKLPTLTFDDMMSLGTYQELSWECTWWYSSIGWPKASTSFHISLSFELQYKNWLFHDDHPSPPLGLGSCSSPQHEWSFGPNSVFGKVQDWSVFWQQWLHKFGLPLIPKSHKGKFPWWSRYKLSLVGFLWQHAFLHFLDGSNWSVSKPSKE